MCELSELSCKAATGIDNYILGKPVGEQSLPVSKEISDLGIEVLS